MLVRRVENLPEHVDRRLRLDGYAGQHSLVVDVADELAGACLRVGSPRGRVGGCGGDGGLIVKAVQIAAGVPELADPFLGLLGWGERGKPRSSREGGCWGREIARGAR